MYNLSHINDETNTSVEKLTSIETNTSVEKLMPIETNTSVEKLTPIENKHVTLKWLYINVSSNCIDLSNAY